MRDSYSLSSGEIAGGFLQEDLTSGRVRGGRRV